MKKEIIAMASLILFAISAMAIESESPIPYITITLSLFGFLATALMHRKETKNGNL